MGHGDTYFFFLQQASRKALDAAKTALTQGKTDKQSADALLDASQDILATSLDKAVSGNKRIKSMWNTYNAI